MWTCGCVCCVCEFLLCIKIEQWCHHQQRFSFFFFFFLGCWPSVPECKSDKSKRDVVITKGGRMSHNIVEQSKYTGQSSIRIGAAAGRGGGGRRAMFLYSTGLFGYYGGWNRGRSKGRGIYSESYMFISNFRINQKWQIEEDENERESETEMMGRINAAPSVCCV